MYEKRTIAAAKGEPTKRIWRVAKTVLLESQSYPILVFEKMEGGEVGLGVREYKQGRDEYIALSHVRCSFLFCAVACPLSVQRLRVYADKTPFFVRRFGQTA